MRQVTITSLRSASSEMLGSLITETLRSSASTCRIGPVNHVLAHKIQLPSANTAMIPTATGV